VQCGETERPFEIDHIDPKTKVSHRIWSWSAERREAELAKCQLLCVDCHYKKTGTENATGQNHGETLYAKGCRCEICVSTRAANKKRIRAERKALGLPYQ
jgi:5-methylcytosine-specific restriction endonuclease McrA